MVAPFLTLLLISEQSCVQNGLDVRHATVVHTCEHCYGRNVHFVIITISDMFANLLQMARQLSTLVECYCQHWQPLEVGHCLN